MDHHVIAGEFWTSSGIVTEPVRRLEREVPRSGQTIGPRMDGLYIPNQYGVEYCVHY